MQFRRKRTPAMTEASAELSGEKPHKRKKRGGKVFLTLLAAIVAGILFVTYGQPALRYREAARNAEAGNISEAAWQFLELGDYRDAVFRAHELFQLELTLEQYDYAMELWENGHLDEAYESFSYLQHEDERARANMDAIVQEVDASFWDLVEEGELRKALGHLELLEKINPEQGAALRQELTAREHLEPDTSHYDGPWADRIRSFDRATTAEQFATAYVHMLLNGKTSLRLNAREPAVTYTEAERDAVLDRMLAGYSLADEWLPEYGSIYQGGAGTYWSSESRPLYMDLITNENNPYSAEELRAHVERVETFCQESFRALNDACLLGASMSNRQKAEVIYDWVAYYFIYDNSKEIHDAGVAVDAQMGVCESYAAIYNRMCNLAGVPSYAQMGDAGTAGDTELHLWSIQLDEEGNVFYTDATWGDKDAWDAEGDPSVEDFLQRYHDMREFYDSSVQYLVAGPDGLIPLEDTVGGSQLTDRTYFWQESVWATHTPERTAEEIVSAPLHKNA